MPDKQKMSQLAQTRRTLPIALLRARESVMERFRPMLNRLDVSEQQWRVLRVLREVEALDASELANRASILAPSLSRILKTLESKQFIALKKDPNDGRRTLVSLTEAGTEFLLDAAPDSAAIYAEIEAIIGHDRIESLIDELDDLITKLSKPTE